MFKYYSFLFLLLSSLSYSQVDDILNILDMPLCLSMESVKELWDKNNMNKYARLITETDDAIKYEGKSDSLILGVIFYFVNDSLYCFSFYTKFTLNKAKHLINSVNNNFGNPDSIVVEKLGSETKGNLKAYTLSFWSRINYINNSIDNISVSQEQFSEGLNLFSFSSCNTALSYKARIQKKHQLKL